MERIAKAVDYREEDQIFEVNYWDGSYAEIPLQEAVNNAIIVKEDKTAEEWLIYRMAEGWNINIECKGKGRTYEMSYEATATKVASSLEDHVKSFMNMRHAVGDTLWELMHNLFDEKAGGKDEEISKKIVESN